MARSWGYLLVLVAALLFSFGLRDATAQPTMTAVEKINQSIEQTPVPVLLRRVEEASAPSDSDDGHGKFRTRQAMILSGVALSMLAYGYFVLKFNNSRTDSDQARLAYEADVRENAQSYVDQNVELDQIPTYFAWEAAYTDAANNRELVTIAGLSAFLLSMAAILDSATAGNDEAPHAQARSVSPLLDMSPTTGDVRLGARIGL